MRKQNLQIKSIGESESVSTAEQAEKENHYTILASPMGAWSTLCSCYF